MDEPAAAMRRHQGASVFAYRFDWDEEPSVLWLDGARLLGAAHAVELFFVFGGTSSDFARRWLLEDPESADRLSRQMRSYWARFAATGASGRGQSGDLPEWPPWDPTPGGPKFLILDSPRDQGLQVASTALTSEGVLASVARDPELATAEERCEIYQTFVRWTDQVMPDEYPKLDGGACAAFPLPGRTAYD